MAVEPHLRHPAQATGLWTKSRRGVRHWPGRRPRGQVLRGRAGDTVICPPDEAHWHGAASDIFISHLAVLEADYGTTTRTISAPLWAALIIRDSHCRHPGCDRPPDWCEGHHVQWVEHGGETNLPNLVMACSRHHHLWHHPGWDLKLKPDATLEITTPTGHVLTSRPPPPVASRRPKSSAALDDGMGGH